MLDLLSLEAICKSFLPLKTIFLGEKSQTLFLLRAAVVFCWSEYVQEVVLVLPRDGFIKSIPRLHLKNTRKFSAISWLSVLQNPLQLPQKATSGAGGLLMHCITSFKLILIQCDTQIPKSLEPGHVMPVFTATP